LNFISGLPAPYSVASFSLPRSFDSRFSATQYLVQDMPAFRCSPPSVLFPSSSCSVMVLLSGTSPLQYLFLRAVGTFVPCVPFPFPDKSSTIFFFSPSARRILASPILQSPSLSGRLLLGWAPLSSSLCLYLFLYRVHLVRPLVIHVPPLFSKSRNSYSPPF